jgi:hypothetical protein
MLGHGWMSSLSYVRSVSVFILLFRILLNQLVVIFVLRTWAIWERSRPILVLLIGLAIVTVAVPHTNYILLTGVEGFCSIIDRCDQASSNGPWHVISLHPCDKRDLTYHLVFSGAIYHCVRRGPISNANKFGPVCMGRIYTVSPHTGSTILCV